MKFKQWWTNEEPGAKAAPSAPPRVGVLFVCLGNICRSPLARAVFEHEAKLAGVADRLRIDSCGTGDWHVGGPADPRTIAVAERHKVAMKHVARQVDPRTDFNSFDLIVAMDRKNIEALVAAGAPRERVRLMCSFDPIFDGLDEHEIPEVPDPYTGTDADFERVFAMLASASKGLLHVATGMSRGQR